jgi:hypothetical protein
MKQSYRTDTVASLATSSNGEGYKVERMIGASFQAIWVDGGALSGTFKLQGSNNAFVDNPTAPENANASWDDVPGSTVTITGTNHDIVNVSDIQYQALRWVYTATAGAGSMRVIICGKGRN